MGGRPYVRIVAFCLLLGAASLLIAENDAPAPPALAQSIPPTVAATPSHLSRPPDKQPKLESQLAAVARAYQQQGPAAAEVEARSRGLTSSNRLVKVEIESVSGGSTAA